MKPFVRKSFQCNSFLPIDIEYSASEIQTINKLITHCNQLAGLLYERVGYNDSGLKGLKTKGHYS